MLKQALALYNINKNKLNRTTLGVFDEKINNDTAIISEALHSSNADTSVIRLDPVDVLAVVGRALRC